jgi:putative N6-adenine-specific DNA methylase
MKERLLVACSGGLESALDSELRELGFETHAAHGGSEVEGPRGTCIEVNVRSRIASRVFWHLGQCQRPAQLKDIEVQRLLGQDVAVSVIRLSDAPRDARSEEWLRQALRAWHLAPPTKDAVQVQLHLGAEGAQVLADSSGAHLHFRGSRQEVGRAPLRETLAAGLLRLAGWAPGIPMCDLMCGSGTLLIEAAEQALGVWPGRNRRFAFETWPGFESSQLELARVPRAKVTTEIFGSDINAGALGVARRNARRAGVEAAIRLERVDATQYASTPTTLRGVLVSNLPYGKRVGSKSEVGVLYAALGRSIRRAFRGWQFGFFVETAAEALGLPFDRRFPLSNGGLSCELLVGTIP